MRVAYVQYVNAVALVHPRVPLDHRAFLAAAGFDLVVVGGEEKLVGSTAAKQYKA